MKIDNTYTPVGNLPQSKLAREDKSDGKSDEKTTLSDSVDLGALESSGREAIELSQAEAIETAGSIDYRNAVGAHSLSGDTSVRLMGLI